MNENLPDPRVRPAAPHRVAPLSLTIHQLAGRAHRIPLRAEFRFDPSPRSACTVSITFQPGHELSVTWHISRDLLYDGMLEPTGAGDIRVWPEITARRTMARLCLRSGGGQALFEMELGPLEDWLEATYDLVPAGSEFTGLDWDELLANLIDRGGH